MRSIIDVRWILAFAGVVWPLTAQAADQAALQQWAQSVGTLESISGDKVRRASAVVVTDDGLVVTSFQAALGATKARVVWHGGGACDVVGVVAARRGKDLLLLATKRDEALPATVKLVNRDLRIGEPVHGIGGPGSLPLFASTSTLARFESGQRNNLSRDGNATAAIDADQCRLVTHAYLNMNSLGGGLFGDDGQLVGVLTGSAEWTDRVHVAVHAGYIAELLAARHDPRPLGSLRNWVDAATATAPPTESIPPMPTLDDDDMGRGDSQRAKIEALRRRLSKLPAERKALTDQAEAWRKDARAPQQQFEALQQQAAANRLRFTSIVPEVVVPSNNVAPRPTAGNNRAISVERRFSARQLNERVRLNNEFLGINLQLANVEAERLRHQSRIQQTDFDQAANLRFQSALLRHLFYLVDPLELRWEADIEDSLDELDNEIDQGGAAPVFLVARGLARTRLGRWDEALADLDQAAEDDRTWRPAVEVARNRVLRLRGDAAGRESTARTNRASKDDPILLVLLARIELDQRDASAAVRLLRGALDAGGDPIELYRALALIQSRPNGGSRDLRKARESAQLACALTHGTDWHSLAVLAMVEAAGGAWEPAVATMERAEEVSGDFGREVCRTWQDCLRRRELPIDAWGRTAGKLAGDAP